MLAELALLFVFFASIHSLTAADFFKIRVARILGGYFKYYRALYNTLSVVTFSPFLWYWLTQRHNSLTIFSLHPPVAGSLG
jgi:uncharacterized membrane protein